MKVRVRAFARVREVLGTGDDSLALGGRATVEDVWRNLTARFPLLSPLRRSIRFARNGIVVGPETNLEDGDELALLPPSSGG